MILDAAEKVIARDGWEATNFGEIAKRARPCQRPLISRRLSGRGARGAPWVGARLRAI
ncbi:MAG: hypothetical protein B9S26_01775 [Opitutia bacterium Tous-C4FEB]|nr:MAG: hypothetical protein B9S35_02730 [Opitutae bacterium Tous-C5TDCM]PAW91404.1 MAG: hypothetical protein B9S26_01775 [Opitutae bacterium Tous-C4FEB]